MKAHPLGKKKYFLPHLSRLLPQDWVGFCRGLNRFSVVLRGLVLVLALGLLALLVLGRVLLVLVRWLSLRWLLRERV
jgi:hypothetical protein